MKKSLFLLLFILSLLSLLHANNHKLEFSTQRGASTRIIKGCYSPDGRYIVTAGGEDYQAGEVILWHTDTGKEIKRFKGQNSFVKDVIFSPDGKRIFAGGHGDPSIHVWDIESGEEVLKIDTKKSGVNRLALSPGGDILYSTRSMGTVDVWNPLTGKLIKKIKTNQSLITSLFISPDGSHLFTSGSNGTINMVDLKTDSVIKVFTHHYEDIIMNIDPSGQYLVSGGIDKKVKIWDIASGELIKELAGHNNSICAIDFSKDSQYIISGGLDHTIKLWKRESGELIHSYHEEKYLVSSLEFSPDGKTFLSTATSNYLGLNLPNNDPNIPEPIINEKENRVIIRNIKSQQIVRILQGKTDLITACDISQDNHYAVASSEDIIYVWDISLGKLERIIDTKKNIKGLRLNTVVISPDGKRIAAAGMVDTVDGKIDQSGEGVIEWELKTGKLLKKYPWSYRSSIRDIAYSPNGKYIACVTGNVDRTNFSDRISGQKRTKKKDKIETRSCFSILNTETGLELKSLYPYTKEFSSIVFSEESKTMAVSTREGIISLYALPSAELIGEAEVMSKCRAMDISPDGSLLAVQENSHSASLIDTKTMKIKKSVPSDGRYIQFSPDGKTFASGTSREMAQKSKGEI